VNRAANTALFPVACLLFGRWMEKENHPFGRWRSFYGHFGGCRCTKL